ncbi:MAG: T9SS type A sorting domain-containing protein [Ignavibacteria bacterium]|nr:T9SS type A sorting domain-containing protein [Ignavibacteria bacterium]
MKNGASLRLLCLLLVVTVGAGAQTQFEIVRSKLRATYDRKLPDGTIKESKQVKRWEWFWEPRLTPSGDFPTALHYYNEVQAVESRKKSEDVQAKPTWKELGPTAPDLPSESAAWNGIGRVNTFTFSPSNSNIIWLGSAQGGIWKTTDGGGSWSAINVNGFPTFGVSDIAISASNENVIYVATGDADATFPGEMSSYPGFTYGVIKSTDGGATWSATGLSMTPEQNNVIARLWVDPSNANIAIATTYTGLRKTTDGGATWNLVSASLQFRDLIANPFASNQLYATTFSNGGGASIFRSSDAGNTWTLILSVAEANRIRLAVTKDDPKIVGAVASSASTNGLFAIYKSSDYGLTFVKSVPPQNLLGWSATGNDWQYGGQGFYDLAMEISPTDADKWFVGGVNAWRSTNGGQSWVLSADWTGNNAPWVHADHHFMKYSATQNVIYTASDGGIARSTNNGVSWRDVSNGLKIQQYYGLSTTDMNSTLTLAGAQDNGTARTLNGSVFYHVLDGDGMASAIDYDDPSLMYASMPYGQFYSSSNQGNSWRLIANVNVLGESNRAWVAPIVADPTMTGTVYVGYTQIYKSTTSGASWQKISQIQTNAAMRLIAVAPSDNNFIYVAYNSTIMFTTDGGTTWSQQNGIGSFIQDIEVHPTDPRRFWVAIGGFSASTKIFEINNGKVTNITGSGLPNVPANAIVFQKGPLNRLYLGTDIGVFFKDEGSSSWEMYGQAMPTTVITDMKLVSTANKLRVSTYGRGVWEVDVTQCIASVPSITIQGASTICSGDTIVLKASSGYAQYQWSNGETGDRIKLSAYSQTGEYTVTVEDFAGCRNVSVPVSVTILRGPIKPQISLKQPDTLRSSAIGGITKFQWYLGDSKIQGATSRQFSPSASGLYKVEVENSEGCKAMSDPFQFVLQPTSVADGGSASTFRVWPNPATGQIEIHMPTGSGRAIEIVSITGAIQVVRNVDGGVSEEVINIEFLSAGTYVLRVRSGESIWSTLFVKQ